MGAPILKKDDPVLAEFLKKEEEKELQATRDKPYRAFKDRGPPLKNGKFDSELIRTFGVKVPEKTYFVLGDNHAMSADSRVFGFVPQNNLQGTPSFIIWPPGERWGMPPQSAYQLITFPRALVWSIIIALLALWYVIRRRRSSRRLFPEA
jgi:signal peptidase I